MTPPAYLRLPRRPSAGAALGSAAFSLTLLAAGRASAQAVRVEVRDAVSGLAVPSALVSLREASNSAARAAGPAAEGVTGTAGVRTLGVAPGRYRVEVRRMGHQPFDQHVVAVAGTDTAAVVVRVPRAPVVLTAVDVRANAACTPFTDPAVVALWDAARTALATTALTAASNGPDATPIPARVAFERTLDTAGTLLGEVRTPIPAARGDGRTFWAVDSAVLERRGFAIGSFEDGALFHGPDERALISDAFARTHCFAPARGGGPDGAWLGVRFTPTPDRRVPEVAGVVWLDSASAEPRQVEYDYVWKAMPRDARGVGGRTEFGRLASGAIAVSAWRIRVPRVRRTLGSVVVAGYTEAGGELARPAAPRLRVRGVVYDSLVGGPLAGAVVTRDRAPGVAVTDSAGHFALDSVEAADGAFVFSHPALDSAGLSDLVVPRNLATDHDSVEVTLATPSRATMWTRVCASAPPAVAPGALATPPLGVLAGVVRDARTGLPVPNAGATVAWTELATGPDGRVVAAPRTRTLRADSAGAFRLCGVPTGVELEAQGAAEGTTSGWALASVGPRGLATVDLLVPDAATATVTATGTVRDSTGAAHPGARVTVDGVPGVQAVTNAAGAFRMDGVPAGTRTFVVRAVGYAPLAVSAGLRAESPAPLDVTLRRVVRLAGVTVRGRRGGNAALLGELADRRRLGLGSLLDSTVTARALTMRTVLQQAPFTSLRPVGAGVWGLADAKGCMLAVAVDGRVTDWDEVTDLPTDQVLAVEVYRRLTHVPGRFEPLLVQAAARDRSPLCGIALVWTRAGR